jgi:hypothetical protein
MSPSQRGVPHKNWLMNTFIEYATDMSLIGVYSWGMSFSASRD